MDLAGLTGFSSRTFLRSLPWREHTWEVALLLEVVGGVGSVNTRLASVTRKSSSPLAWMIIVTFLCLDICWHSCSIAESPAKPIENRRRAQSGNHVARELESTHDPLQFSLYFFCICSSSLPSRFYGCTQSTVLSNSKNSGWMLQPINAQMLLSQPITCKAINQSQSSKIWSRFIKISEKSLQNLQDCCRNSRVLYEVGENLDDPRRSM